MLKGLWFMVFNKLLVVVIQSSLLAQHWILSKEWVIQISWSPGLRMQLPRESMERRSLPFRLYVHSWQCEYSSHKWTSLVVVNSWSCNLPLEVSGSNATKGFVISCSLKSDHSFTYLFNYLFVCLFYFLHCSSPWSFIQVWTHSQVLFPKLWPRSYP